MIVTSDNPKTPLKGAPTNDNSQLNASSSQSGPPPSYEAHQVPQVHPIQQYAVQQELTYRESPGRRFWRAFAVAVLIWLLMSMFIQSTVDMVRRSYHRGLDMWTGDFSVPSDVTLAHCISGDEWSSGGISHPASSQGIFPHLHFPHSSEVIFDLPLSADNLFLLSRGPHPYGVVNITTSTTVGNVAKVYLTIRYFDRDVRNLGTKACLIKRQDNEFGVGIFSRRWVGSNIAQHSLYFEATVVLPQSGHINEPRFIKSFETDVPNTIHNIRDLQGLIDFKYISLRGSNAPIHVKSLYALKANIHTSNAPIEGTFNTSRSLFLRTSNAPIRVDVRLENDGSHVTGLTMRTSNGEIKSDVDLVSSSITGGKYMVAASTSNNPLHIGFPTSPVDSELKLLATTSNSPASVSLHPSYEGSLSATTSLFTPSVKKHEVRDPSGKERKRTVEYGTAKGVLIGKVYWSKREGSGSVAIRTSNSPATIEL